jgi:hypothetical protein
VVDPCGNGTVSLYSLRQVTFIGHFSSSVHIYAAQTVYDFDEAAEIGEDIMVRADAEIDREGILEGLEAKGLCHVDAVIIMAWNCHIQVPREGDDTGSAFGGVERQPDEYVGTVTCARALI